MLGSSFRIQEVSTAKDAMESSSGDFDVILLDIMFPDGNGVDICRSIKQNDPHSTVLINSSMETVDAWNQAFEAGADGYFEKRELLNTDPRKICLMINSLVEYIVLTSRIYHDRGLPALMPPLQRSGGIRAATPLVNYF